MHLDQLSHSLASIVSMARGVDLLKGVFAMYLGSSPCWTAWSVFLGGLVSLEDRKRLWPCHGRAGGILSCPVPGKKNGKTLLTRVFAVTVARQRSSPCTALCRCALKSRALRCEGLLSVRLLAACSCSQQCPSCVVPCLQCLLRCGGALVCLAGARLHARQSGGPRCLVLRC